MRTGNIILVSNPWSWKRPLDSLLYMVMRLVIGKWHHVAMAWEVDGQLLIVEARGLGVYPTHIDIWFKRWPNRQIHIIPVECHPDRILEHIGKKYDRSSFLFYCLLRILFKRWWGRTGAGAGEQLYCFEFVALAHCFPNWYCILPDEFISRADALQGSCPTP